MISFTTSWFFSICHGAQREGNKFGAFIPCNSNSNSNDNTTVRDPPRSDHDNTSHQCSKKKRKQENLVSETSTAAAAAAIPWVRSRSFHQTYQLGRLLGRGTFAVVHEAIQRRRTYDVATDHPSAHHHHNNDPSSSFGSSVAVKIVQRKRMDRKQLSWFKNEVEILSNLQHHHHHHDGIVQLYELYKERDYFYLVQERMVGGDLFDRLVKINTYREVDARDAMKSILQAVQYIHSQRVAHRDLKPENLLLKDDSNDTSIKVADFGFAKRVEKPNSLTTLCGSPMYVAPEIINYKPYDERVDMWSIGVILFTILGGYPPFDEPTSIHLTYQQIRQANYEFIPDYWDGISPDAKNLIRSLLELDPTQRLSAGEALHHPWMTGRGEGGTMKYHHQSQSFHHHSVEGRPLNRKNREMFQSFNAQRKKQQRQSTHSNRILKSVSHYWLLSRH